MLISVKLLTKYVIIIYALGSAHEKFGVWIKAVPKSLQRQNSRPGKAKRTAEPFQIETGVPIIDSDAELFMYLIQCIRFGSRKVRRLNRALVAVYADIDVMFSVQIDSTNNNQTTKISSNMNGHLSQLWTL